MQCAGVEHVREKKRGKGRRKGGRESAGGKKNIAKRRFFCLETSTAGSAIKF